MKQFYPWIVRITTNASQMFGWCQLYKRTNIALLVARKSSCTAITYRLKPNPSSAWSTAPWRRWSFKSVPPTSKLMPPTFYSKRLVFDHSKHKHFFQFVPVAKMQNGIRNWETNGSIQSKVLDPSRAGHSCEIESEEGWTLISFCFGLINVLSQSVITYSK